MREPQKQDLASFRLPTTPPVSPYQQGDRLRSDWLAAFNRNRWPPSVGIGGRFASDSADEALIAGERGELHHDLAMNPRQAFGLLERLAGWFDIEMHKRLRRRNWFFDACNRKVSERFKNFRRLH